MKDSENLLTLRHLKAYTMIQMANLIGLTVKQYTLLEKGITALTDDEKKRLCEHFEMPLSFFDYRGRQPFIISLHEGFPWGNR